jgi:hypothetical protein
MVRWGGGTQPRYIKAGEDYFANPRWGDYSHTTLDPNDSLSFWTVQEYVKPEDLNSILFGPYWGTWIANLQEEP